MADLIIVDLSQGMYRRIYAGFIRGKRFNRMDLLAQGWFWRVQAIADDLGNCPGTPEQIYTETNGLAQGVTLAMVTAWVADMERVGLILPYFVDGDRYYHFAGWEKRQPAGKNGRRVARFPIHPEGLGESGGIRGNPGESGGIQGDPGESSSIRPASGAMAGFAGAPALALSAPGGERASESGETPASSDAQPPTGNAETPALPTPPCPSSPSVGAVGRPEGAERSGGIVGQNRKPMSAAERYNARNEANETPGFLAWWAEYPSMRRTDKVQCHDAWHAQKCEPIADKVLQNLRRWKSSWEAPKFAPSALKFLTARHFEAEPDLPAGQSVADPGADADRERAWAEFQAMDETARNETLARAWKIAPGLRDKPIDAPGMKGAVAMAMRKVAV